ncbi:methionyl-tRNA formyltransferase [Calidifontibacillus erzurumensis]|uniref:methionyl-tRNA formyltransferase n=1 Tax=Calidifontibacillus erzurumensis TaxID=2741433 RepID=UPI0035B56F46
MKRVVFFGSIGLAKKCLEEIVMKQKINLLGVCCNPTLSDWRDDESVYSFCIRNNIPILTFDEVEKLSPDVGFSVRYDKIIPERVINSFKQGIFNTHGGILPSYRGSYCNINALINNENEYGVTLHYISKGVDTGDIVAVKIINISNDDTGFTLYKKSEQLCYEILKENIKDILNGTNNRISQDDLINNGHSCNTYYAKNTLAKKFIDIKDIEKSANIIRAFDSPYHEPAFTIIEGRKVYLRVKYNSVEN